MKQNVTRTLIYSKLTTDSLEFWVYANAPYFANDDPTSQLGYIIFLCDESDKFHILDVSSKKFKRFVRSITAAAVYAFMDSFDVMTVLDSDSPLLLKQTIPLNTSTDSNLLFHALTRGKRATKKRLMIGTKSARKSYKRFKTSAIRLVRGNQNPSDAFTK